MHGQSMFILRRCLGNRQGDTPRLGGIRNRDRRRRDGQWGRRGGRSRVDGGTDGFVRKYSPTTDSAGNFCGSCVVIHGSC